ncbi:MAG TPA: hypothetical protein VIV40_22840 [Kofleriaceae bacterium]
MKPYLVVMAMSSLASPIVAARRGSCHLQTATKSQPPNTTPAAKLARQAHMFDYSDTELRTLLDWLRLEREAA